MDLGNLHSIVTEPQSEQGAMEAGACIPQLLDPAGRSQDKKNKRSKDKV